MTALPPPRSSALRMFGAPAALDPLGWDAVDDWLEVAPIYWVIASDDGRPHPRPVWGVWFEQKLFVTTGSPALVRAHRAGALMSTHLESANEVVVLEGHGDGAVDDPAIVERYDGKYDWHYDVAEYGPLLRIRPARVLAWTSAGPAGRDGFRRGGSWSFA